MATTEYEMKVAREKYEKRLIVQFLLPTLISTGMKLEKDPLTNVGTMSTIADDAYKRAKEAAETLYYLGFKVEGENSKQ